MKTNKEHAEERSNRNAGDLRFSIADAMKSIIRMRKDIREIKNDIEAAERRLMNDLIILYGGGLR